MSGPKRNPDKLNTIGVVVVGVCGAVMVYVAIVALQAFYMNDTSEIQTMADYGGQETTARGKRADELRNITEAASNPAAPGASATYRIDINAASTLVAQDAKKDPSHLTGSALPKAVKETIPPAFGRPRIGGDTLAPRAPGGAQPGAPADPAGAGSAAPAGGGSGAASGSGAAAGSAAQPAGAPGPGASATQTTTGSGPGAPPSAPSRDSAPATPPGGRRTP